MTKKNSLSARKKDYSLFVSLERKREEKRIKKREKMRAKVAAARAAEREKGEMQVDGEDNKNSSENNARKKSAQIAFGSRRRPHRKRFSKTRQRFLQKAKQERKNREEKRASMDTDDTGEVETAA